MSKNKWVTTVVLVLTTVNLIMLAIWLLRQSPDASSTLRQPTVTAKLVENQANPIPTPFPEMSAPIMGFRFGQPQIISSTIPIRGVSLVDWLPHSSEEVLIHGTRDLGILNLKTGQMEVYTTSKVPGEFRHPVWVNNPPGITYFTIDETGFDLWLAQTGNINQLQARNVEPPSIPIDDGRGVIVYNHNLSDFQAVGDVTDKVPHFAVFFNQIPYFRINHQETRYRVTVHPNNNLIAYYNSAHFFLLDLGTGTVDEVDLGRLWALNARWSPDGERLALLLTEGLPPVSFAHLYLYNLQSTQLIKVDLNFTVIKDVVWAPDNQHLLIEPMVGEQGGIALLALYLLDSEDPTTIEQLPLHTQNLGSGLIDGGLGWSPDGTYLLLKYSNEVSSTLHKVDVLQVSPPSEEAE